MYALWLHNGDPTFMTADFCVLVGGGAGNAEQHVRITNVGTPNVPHPDGQTLDGCLTATSRVESCDGCACQKRLVEKQVMILAPDLAREIVEMLNTAQV